MPPRYSYWTILAGGLPTAFRAAERADLLPTFNRIREKHPDAEMKWFARGRLWPSPDDAQADLQRARVRRDRDWRPGGEHRDPRQAFATKRKRDNSGRQQAPREQAPREPLRREQAPRAQPRREQAPREQPPRQQFRPEHTRREQAPREPRRERSSARPPSKSAPTERRTAPPPKRRPR
jgi:hypothetical protein